ncbi:hypothetical protein KAZ92_01965 [Candidatus Gracilibacteria bacterium]|nr:hypothetical protein [Candidatus Gracilibacteria bacterium]
MNSEIEACVDKCKTLTSEIEKFKNATEVNIAAANSLKQVSTALEQVTKRIQPLADSGFLRLQQIVIALVVLNAFLISTVLFFLLRK